MRVISPATKPPISRSSPSSWASATRPNTSSTAIRTASWLDCSSERSSNGQPWKAPRTAASATSTASTMKTIRITASWTGWVVESTSVTSRIGPNSPIAPAASRSVAKRVRISPASRRTGISVPIAVVASAEPV